MPSNSFGNLFRITTWGESHGKLIGVVIDGCPAGLAITEELINADMRKRRPGFSTYTSPRREQDEVLIASGVFNGVTTGAPISLIIQNQDVDSSKYDSIKDLCRPGHANFTYTEKYGVFDHQGGGRASARETACRVAAAAVAKALLKLHNIDLCAYVSQVGSLEIDDQDIPFDTLKQNVANSPFSLPSHAQTDALEELLSSVMKQGDSVGGIITCQTTPLPVGLGDPVYEKLESTLAKAMLSIPAVKGFEMGAGFSAASMYGSEHNDPFISVENRPTLESNHSGGTLGGISTGKPLSIRVACKPTSSIKITQKTATLSGEPATFSVPEGSRHDPCVALRAPSVIEAMTALTLADAILMSRLSKADLTS